MFVSLTDKGIDRFNHNEYDEANNEYEESKVIKLKLSGVC